MAVIEYSIWECDLCGAEEEYDMGECDKCEGCEHCCTCKKEVKDEA
jgi:hypothetical protein